MARQRCAKYDRTNVKITETEAKMTDHTVHIGLSPDDVVVVVNDHRPAQNVKVLHHIFLNISQRGHMRVITCRMRNPNPNIFIIF